MWYRKLPELMIDATFGISSLWSLLLSGCGYFRGIVTFGEKKCYKKLVGLRSFYEIKDGNSLKKYSKYETILRSSLNPCCCHMAGLFMRRLLQWFIRKATVSTSSRTVMLVGSIISQCDGWIFNIKLKKLSFLYAPA